MLDLAYMPRWLQWTLPLLQWRGPRSAEKRLYLTFDDGPTPGVTEPILEILQGYEARATFFCLGQSIESSPDLLRRIVSEGHVVGNHGMRHLNGWACSTSQYIEDVLEGNESIERTLGMKPHLFRPPYGRCTWSQWWRLRGRYRFVMWDINSQDYRQDLTTDVLRQQMKQRIRAVRSC